MHRTPSGWKERTWCLAKGKKAIRLQGKGSRKEAVKEACQRAAHTQSQQRRSPGSNLHSEFLLVETSSLEPSEPVDN